MPTPSPAPTRRAGVAASLVRLGFMALLISAWIAAVRARVDTRREPPEPPALPDLGPPAP